MVLIMRSAFTQVKEDIGRATPKKLIPKEVGKQTKKSIFT
jgi:hypothetical protein